MPTVAPDAPLGAREGKLFGRLDFSHLHAVDRERPRRAKQSDPQNPFASARRYIEDLCLAMPLGGAQKWADHLMTELAALMIVERDRQEGTFIPIVASHDIGGLDLGR